MKILNKFKSYSFGVIMWFPLIYVFFNLIKAPKSLFTDINSVNNYINTFISSLPNNPLYSMFIKLFNLIGFNVNNHTLILFVAYTLSWALLIHIVKLVYDVLDIFFHYLESLVERGL